MKAIIETKKESKCERVKKRKKVLGEAYISTLISEEIQHGENIDEASGIDKRTSIAFELVIVELVVMNYW